MTANDDANGGGIPRGVARAPGIQPGTKSADDLPPDQVALVIWHAGAPITPTTVVVTRASWDMNKKVVMDAGNIFVPDRIYEFESPINPKGRRMIHHFAGVLGWVANVSVSIVPVRHLDS